MDELNHGRIGADRRQPLSVVVREAIGIAVVCFPILLAGGAAVLLLWRMVT